MSAVIVETQFTLFLPRYMFHLLHFVKSFKTHSSVEMSYLLLYLQWTPSSVYCPQASK